jgi:hypothetical protein
MFGLKSPTLVDGVTKISKIHFKTKEENQAENFRKMLLAMANRYPGDPGQAGRPSAQHAHPAVPA